MERLTGRTQLGVLSSISSLVGGIGWKRQSIGQLGPLTTGSVQALRALRSLVEVAYEVRSKVLS